MRSTKRDFDLKSDYEYHGHGKWDNEYLMTPVSQIIDNLNLSDKRLFEIGFGSGWTANYFSKKGYQVSGVEASESAVAVANKAYPNLLLRFGNAYQKLYEEFGIYPLVYSIEVIEHVKYPRLFLKTVYELLEKNGYAVISTPYHGYLKNLAVALLNKSDEHFNPLWDEGHLRFFLRKHLPYC